MKLIHIENKIDPNDVVKVMRDAKLDFAMEVATIIKQAQGNSRWLSGDEIIETMRRLLNVGQGLF
jgi:hypothetical protein